MSNTTGNPIKGFKINDIIHQVDYESLANKPFGDKTEITLFSCDAIPFEDDEQGHDPTTYVQAGPIPTGADVYGTPTSPWFIDGAILTIIWDGVEYHLPFMQHNGLYESGINVNNITIVNDYYDLIQDDEDPSFAIAFFGTDSDTYVGINDIITHDAGATHSLVIKYTATSKISNNYYSPNIARQFDVQTEKIGIFTHTHYYEQQ